MSASKGQFAEAPTSYAAWLQNDVRRRKDEEGRLEAAPANEEGRAAGKVLLGRLDAWLADGDKMIISEVPGTATGFAEIPEFPFPGQQGDTPIVEAGRASATKHHGHIETPKLAAITAGDKIKAALAFPKVAKEFPVPQYKQEGIEKPPQAIQEETACVKNLISEFEDAVQVPAAGKFSLTHPCLAAHFYEAGGSQHLTYGPFTSRDELFAAVKLDPMLQPVRNKWSDFDASVVDAATQRGMLYLQIKWDGQSPRWWWRADMTKEQLASLMEKARA